MRYLVTAIPTRKCLANASLTVQIIDLEKAKLWTETDFKSLLWHEPTRAVAASLLDRPLEKLTRRQAGIISVKPGDELLITEYTGPDLQCDTAALPDGGKSRWLIVKVSEYSAS